ncbi:MAG: dethiobiotin synthase [Acidiferrobacterales bacterium]
MSHGWFVTGTDTGVGKTLVAAALINKLANKGEQVVGMKPVASGCHNTGVGLRNPDAEILVAAANVKADYRDVNPYAFEPAVSPHLAAHEAGIKIELENVFKHFELLKQQSEIVVVEGVGGWMAPLGHVITNEHLAKSLGLPVILVVGLRLGCINHALLTAQAIEAAGLKLGGWVANTIDPDMERPTENVTTLRQRIPAPMLGQVPHLGRCDFRTLSNYIAVPQ